MREGFFVVTEEGTYVSVNEVVPKKIWQMLSKGTFIWCENILIDLSLDIICSSLLTVLLEFRSRNTARLWEQMIS